MKIMKFRNDNKRYFNKIIRSYSPFIVLIFIISILVCVYISNNILIKRKELQLNSISGISDSLQTEFYELQKLSYILMKNIKFEDYITYYAGRNGAVADYSSLKKLQDILNVIKSVKKDMTRILVYSPKNQLIISDDGIYGQDEYYRIFSNFQAMDQTVFSQTHALDYFKVFPTISVLEHTEANTLSEQSVNIIPIGISCLDLYSIDAIIEVNLDESQIREQINKGALTINTVGLLLDSMGNVISKNRFGNLNSEDLKTLAKYVEQPLTEQKLTLKGQNYIVYSIYLDALAWRLLYLVPQVEYYSPILQFLCMFILGFLIVFIMCIIMTYRFSKRLYSPISSLVAMASDPGLSSESVPLDEITVITEYLEALKCTKLNLTDKIYNIKEILHEYIIKQILVFSDGMIGNDDIDDIFNEYNIHMEEPYFIVSIFNIYFKPLFFSNFLLDEQKIIQKAIPKFLDDQLHLHFANVYLLSFEEHRSLIVINDHDPNCGRKLINVLKSINNLIEADHFLVQFSFAVSDVQTNVSSLNNAYKEIYQNCQFYMLNCGNPLVNEKTMNTDTTCHIPETYGENLKSAVISGNKHGIEQLVRSAYKQHPIEENTPYRFKKITGTLGTVYEYIGDSLGFSGKMDVSYNEFLSVKLYDVEGTCVLFEHLLWRLHTSYIGQGVDKSKLMKYIDENYLNTNLSLQIMADNFHLNINYLSRLFKEQAVVTFTEYLSEIRISKAKKMIIETDMLIDDICEHVGISNRRTFNRMFKKMVGASPAMYRILNR